MSNDVLALGEVVRARLERKAFDCTERRDDLRRFLDMNGAPSRSPGFNLHGDARLAIRPMSAPLAERLV